MITFRCAKCATDRPVKALEIGARAAQWCSPCVEQLHFDLEAAGVRLVQAARTWSRLCGGLVEGTDADADRRALALRHVYVAITEIDKLRSELPPGTCVECGCTDENACTDELKVLGEVTTCSWVDASHTLCSTCDESDGAS